MTTEDTPAPLSLQGIIGGTTAVFSMKQAAEVAGISVSTLRRRRADLIAAGAHITPEGWKVPMTALVACGLIAGEGPTPASRTVSVATRPPHDLHSPAHTQQLADLTAQVHELEREVAEWRRRAEVAEVRAEERGRALDTLRVANETERMALRMLTAGTSTAPQMQSPPDPAQPVKEAAPAPTPQASASMAHHSASTPEKLQRKGFFSRVMGL